MTPEQTEAHRHACEVRQVIEWRKRHGREWARTWLESVAKARGKEAAQRLGDDARKAWDNAEVTGLGPDPAST